MAYIHSQNPPIIHRDLKPLNIIVTKDDVVKITDFGLAKVLDLSAAQSTVMKGTPHYMSPEQIREPGNIDVRTDVYSLGMSLYVMLCGRLPFDPATDNTPMLIYEKVVNKQIPPPTEYYSGITESLAAYVMKAIHPNRKRRFSSAQQMLDKLELLEDRGETIMDYKPPRLSTFPDNEGRHDNEHRHKSASGDTSQHIRENRLKNLIRLSKSRFSRNLLRKIKPFRSKKFNIIFAAVSVSLVCLILLFQFLLKDSIPTGKGLEMVFVKGRKLASSSSGADRDEPGSSNHSYLIIPGFYIGKYEVTQKLWEEVMGSNRSMNRGDNLPVENISWFEAVEFCNRLSDIYGLQRAYEIRDTMVKCDFNANGYRLPTESEWEYAATGNSNLINEKRNEDGQYDDDSDDYDSYSGEKYGDVQYFDGILRSEFGWYQDNSDFNTHPGGKKLPNGLGLYDFIGNVLEWCWDLYENYYFPFEENPNGSESGTERVLRGGCWASPLEDLTLSKQFKAEPNTRSSVFGLRLVKSK